MSEHWAVTVSRSGETIVTIESNCLCGRDISPEDYGTIRTAALHLLGFIGESPENAALAARDARVAELELKLQLAVRSPAEDLIAAELRDNRSRKHAQSASSFTTPRESCAGSLSPRPKAEHTPAAARLSPRGD